MHLMPTRKYSVLYLLRSITFLIVLVVRLLDSSLLMARYFLPSLYLCLIMCCGGLLRRHEYCEDVTETGQVLNLYIIASNCVLLDSKVHQSCRRKSDRKDLFKSLTCRGLQGR